MDGKDLVDVRNRLAAPRAAKDVVLVLGQFVPFQTRPADRDGQGHLIQIGALAFKVRQRVDVTGGVIPDLRKALALGRAILFGEQNEARAVVGHDRHPPVAHQADTLIRHRHVEGAIDPLPQIRRGPSQRGGGRGRDMSGTHKAFDRVGARHHHIAVDKARKLGIARLKAGEDLVAMRIDRVEHPLGLEAAHLAVHPAQRLDGGGIDLGQAVFRAIAHQSHLGRKMLADRGGQIAGKILIARRLDDEEQGQAGRHGIALHLHKGQNRPLKRSGNR